MTFKVWIQNRVCPDSQIDLKSKNPIKKIGAERTSYFDFLKIFGLEGISDVYFLYTHQGRAEADFCFCKFHWSVAEIGFLLSSGRGGLRIFIFS